MENAVNKKLILVCGALLVTSPALAQVVEQQTTVVKDKQAEGTAAGAVTGAATGAVVGGPVGAAVGAVVGAAVGSAASPPKEVRTYVTTQTVAPTAYGRPIVVGRPIEGQVSWLEVPNYPKYRWAYLDGRRVVIDQSSRNVVAVYAAEPPAGVRTYVTTKQVPAVTYGQPIMVGSPVGGNVTWLDVPEYPKFRWAYVDGQRVVVDTDTNTVVAIY
jgi:hypothetical protein